MKPGLRESEKTKCARKFIANNLDKDMKDVIKAAVEISGASEGTVRRVYEEIAILRMRSLAEQNRRSREKMKVSVETYKGRPRRKFLFDVDKLFGFEKEVIN